MSRKVKWGILGAGGIAKRRTIPEGFMTADAVELVVVSNPEVAEKYGVAAATDIEDLLRYDIDAVYIATPAHLHVKQTVACARAGKHVLCEKPLGLTVEEAEKMVSSCTDEGVLLGTALMMRFQAQHQAALKMVSEGRLGKLTFGRAQLSCWYPPIEGAWRQDPSTGGGGSLMDLGSHCIDLVELFFGRAVQVSCFTNNTVHAYPSEDSAVATLFFENGAMAVVDTFFCIPDHSSKNVLEIYGSKGSILARNTIGQGDRGEMTAYLETGATEYNAQQQRAGQRGLSVDPESVNTYRAEIEEFCQAIIEGRTPANSGKLGLRNQRILAACYESARTGKAVQIREDP